MKKKCKFESHEPTPAEWGQICSVPWGDSLLREAIGKLFAQKGYGCVNLIFGKSSRSRIARVNRRLADHNINLRLRTQRLPEEALRNYGETHIIGFYLKRV